MDEFALIFTIVYFGIIILIVSTWWIIFKKMGHHGWESLIPIWFSFVVCEELYGNGWKCLFALIPFYNIYFALKIHIDLANRFGKGVGFTLGMIFLPIIFYSILAFGNAQYHKDSYTNKPPCLDPHAAGETETKDLSSFAPAPQNDKDVLEELNLLSDLRLQGVISEEEFDKKKLVILNRL